MSAMGSTRLVLAFDIGTTYSSIAYCILEPNVTPEVRAVARFPAQGVGRADTKVPSLLYYDRCGVVRAVGTEALAPDLIQTARAEGWAKAEWWKLHLHPSHLAASIDDLSPLPQGKSVVDVLADFIKYLFDWCKVYIQECHPELAWTSLEPAIEYILTYPSGWDQQQHLYRQAMARAGLVPGIPSGQSWRVHLLTAGESGVHFCVLKFLNQEGTKPWADEGIGMIDAGGGFIDLSLYSITMTSSKITCEMISSPECRPQGSIFVTRRAMALIKKKLQGWPHATAEDINRFACEFNQTTKLVIESDQQPAYVRVAGRRVHSSRHCISSGQLKLSGDEATGLFADTVDAIIGAFEQQEKLAPVAIRTVFLVGGLSKNDWVWSQLRSYFMAKNITIHRLDNHGNKVVAQGALLSCLYGNDHFEDALATRDLHRDPKVPEKERHGKTSLYGLLNQLFRKVLVLAERSKWLWLNFGVQIGSLAYRRDTLSNSQQMARNPWPSAIGSHISARPPRGHVSEKPTTSDIKKKSGSGDLFEVEWMDSVVDGSTPSLAKRVH